MTKITIENIPVKQRNTRPVEAVAVVRYIHPQTGIVHYHFDRQSKKRSASEPDYYDFGVIEVPSPYGLRYVALPCQCYNYVNDQDKRIPKGRCKHQKEAVSLELERQQPNSAIFPEELERGVL
jgi:hypothetical protein